MKTNTKMRALRESLLAFHPVHPLHTCLKFLVFLSLRDSRFFGRDREDEQDEDKYEDACSP